MKYKTILKKIYNPLVTQYIQLRYFLKLRYLPAFIILGAQKGGTTSLYKRVVEHPQMLSAVKKELQYFNDNYTKGIRWYKACFPSAAYIKIHSEMLGKPVITGEATPYYLAYPNAPKNIAETVPNVKLIVLLRNPVNRAISHYHHMVRIKRETLPLHEAIACEEDRLSGEVDKMRASQSYSCYTHATYSYLTRGRYVDQLEAFAKIFPRDQMLVLKSEDFYANTQLEFNKVLEFLNLEPYTLKNIKPENEGNYGKTDNNEVRRELQRYFEPYNERLYKFLGIDLGW